MHFLFFFCGQHKGIVLGLEKKKRKTFDVATDGEQIPRPVELIKVVAERNSVGIFTRDEQKHFFFLFA
ncbi:Uncharacterized protein APZ42_010909 [Daphnia magna]|uniref:Uncharacterized protein n=1 Tax=Daphnia magna TaxID=35525 RepID=A0A162T9F1_9CRUS|nr:Uncharacterized protein APZ42_010909 [Daphnia magna]